MIEDGGVTLDRIDMRHADQETRALATSLRDLLEASCGHEDGHNLEAGCDLDGPLLKGLYVLGYPFDEAAELVWGSDYKSFILEENESEDDLGYRVSLSGLGVEDISAPDDFKAATRAVLRENLDALCESEMAVELEEGENLSGPVVTAFQALDVGFEDAAKNIWGPDWQNEVDRDEAETMAP